MPLDLLTTSFKWSSEGSPKGTAEIESDKSNTLPRSLEYQDARIERIECSSGRISAVF